MSEQGAGRAKRSRLERTWRGVSTRARRAADWVSGRKRLEGFVDRVLASEVLGWAFDPNKPNRRVHIIAVRGGEIIAETLADLPRKDLNRHGKGDGRHGFNLRLPPQAMNGAGAIRIEAAIGRRRILLRGGEIAAPAPRAARRLPAPAAADAPCGILERLVDGVLYGWARDPEAGTEPIVIDVYDDERYLGSATAERAKPKLRESAPGAKAFQFVVPDAPAGAKPRLRARIARTGLYLRDLGEGHAPRPKPAAAAAARASSRHSPMVGLVIVGDGSADSLRKTTRSWTDQSWPHLTVARVSGADDAEAAEHVFGPSDQDRLRDFVRKCADLIFVRPGETLDLQAASLVAGARPQADVLTWDIGDEAGGQPMRRRSEAWPLAILLGGSLGGGFALRRPVAEPMTAALARIGDPAGMRAFELGLARRDDLRWAHLPAALSVFDREAARPPKIRPTASGFSPSSITVAVWPGWSADSLLTLTSLAPRLGAAPVEVVIPAKAWSVDVQDAVQAAFPPGAAVTVRPVDLAGEEGAGRQMRSLAEAATGEVVLLVRAGVLVTGGDLAAMAGWALSPMVGAVTGEIAYADTVIAGVTVIPSRAGWRTISGFDPHRQGVSRPMLSATASLMAISRGKLAAVSGFDTQRFPVAGADLDLCLRLRRQGWTSIILGDVTATSQTSPLRRDGVSLAHHDIADLAAASAAYPPSSDRSRSAPDTP